jgi:hypothetical protein
MREGLVSTLARFPWDLGVAAFRESTIPPLPGFLSRSLIMRCLLPLGFTTLDRCFVFWEREFQEPTLRFLAFSASQRQCIMGKRAGRNPSQEPSLLRTRTRLGPLPSTFTPLHN